MDKKLRDEIAEIFRELSRGYPVGGYGVKTITAAGTPERISDQDVKIAQIMITALRTNTGYIYIGFDEFVSSTDYGKELMARDFVVIPIDNLHKLWMDSSVNGEGISYILVV